MARMCEVKDEVRRGDAPSIFVGVGVAEFTIWPNHWSGFGRLAVDEMLRVGERLGCDDVLFTCNYY